MSMGNATAASPASPPGSNSPSTFISMRPIDGASPAVTETPTSSGSLSNWARFVSWAPSSPALIAPGTMRKHKVFVPLLLGPLVHWTHPTVAASLIANQEVGG